MIAFREVGRLRRIRHQITCQRPMADQRRGRSNGSKGSVKVVRAGPCRRWVSLWSARAWSGSSWPTSGVLGAYVSGESARALSSASEARRVDALVLAVEKVHPGARALLLSETSEGRDEDPYARDAYAWARPGELSRVGASLGSPEGRVHFAGDHVSYRPGFMHGAVASAKKGSSASCSPWPEKGIPETAEGRVHRARRANRARLVASTTAGYDPAVVLATPIALER